MKKIDVHAHLGEWFSPDRGGVGAIIAALREWDVERCILSAGRALLVDMAAGNRELQAVVEQHEELLAYTYVDPTHPDEAVAEIERYAKHPKFVGIKSRPEYHGERIDGPGYRPILEAAAAHHLPSLIHFWDPTPPRGHVAVVNEFKTPMILAHAGGNLWRQCVDCVADTPDLYLDFCSSVADAGKIEYGVRKCGADRVIFGSDLMLIHPAWTMGMYLDAEITEDDRRKIFRDNAIRLFHLKV